MEKEGEKGQGKDKGKGKGNGKAKGKKRKRRTKFVQISCSEFRFWLYFQHFWEMTHWELAWGFAVTAAHKLFKFWHALALTLFGNHCARDWCFEFPVKTSFGNMIRLHVQKIGSFGGRCSWTFCWLATRKFTIRCVLGKMPAWVSDSLRPTWKISLRIFWYRRTWKSRHTIVFAFGRCWWVCRFAATNTHL